MAQKRIQRRNSKATKFEREREKLLERDRQRELARRNRDQAVPDNVGTDHPPQGQESP